MWHAVWVVVRILIWVYVGLLVVLAGCQRRFLYYPQRVSEEEAVQAAAVDGLTPWRNEAGEIIGWRPEEPKASDDAMLLFHGNAGHAAHRGYFARGFAPDIAVYVFEYPGYGPRDGRPSETTFYEKGADALQQLRATHTGRIFLGGESLGTGVASFLAGAYPEAVDGLFLATAFNRMTDVARHHYPIFPVGRLLRDRYESDTHLQTYDGPVAVLLAGEDEVVPARFGKKLYEGYHGPKRLWVQEGRDHNTMDYSPGSPWWREVVEFLQRENRSGE